MSGPRIGRGRLTMKMKLDGAALMAVAVAFATACDTGPSAPVGQDFGTDGDLDAETEVQTYEGDWTIFGLVTDTEPQDIVSATCSGSVTITTRTSSGGRVEILSGSYVVLAEGGCAAGSTISGGLTDINLRSDGGIDFGLEVPGSDGNMFEDFLVGSGLEFSTIQALGCSDPQGDGPAGEAKDEVNHLDGTLLEGRLRAAASASMKCPGGGKFVVDEETGERIAQEETVQVKISIDLERTAG